MSRFKINGMNLSKPTHINLVPQTKQLRSITRRGLVVFSESMTLCFFRQSFLNSQIA